MFCQKRKDDIAPKEKKTTREARACSPQALPSGTGPALRHHNHWCAEGRPCTLTSRACSSDTVLQQNNTWTSTTPPATTSLPRNYLSQIYSICRRVCTRTCACLYGWVNLILGSLNIVYIIRHAFASLESRYRAEYSDPCDLH